MVIGGGLCPVGKGGKKLANGLGRGAGNPDGFVPRLLAGDDGDGRLGDVEELCEIFDAEAVCLTLDGGRRQADFDGIALDAANSVPGGPGLDMDGKGDAVGVFRDPGLSGLTITLHRGQAFCSGCRGGT